MYDLWAKPDGEECLEKTFWSTVYSTAAGAVFSICEIVLCSKPTTPASIIARFGRFTLPFGGMGIAFGSTVCIMAHLRKKDDVANHVLGGAAAGAVWGFKYNSIRMGHIWAVYLGLLGGYHKFFRKNNYPTFPMAPEEFRASFVRKDFSIKLYDDPGRPNLP